jgi:hypothetical protein
MEYLEKTVDDELLMCSMESQPYPVLGGYLWNKLFRRAVWRDLFFEEGIHFADMTAVMAYLGRTHGVRLIPSCHYYYLQREGSITHCRLNKHSADFVEMRKKQKAFIIQQGADQSLISRSDMLILLAYIHLIRTCLMAGTKKSNIFDIYLQDFQYILRCNIYCLRYIGSFKILVKIFLLYFCPACYVYIWRLKNGLDLLRI